MNLAKQVGWIARPLELYNSDDERGTGNSGKKTARYLGIENTGLLCAFLCSIAGIERKSKCSKSHLCRSVIKKDM